MPVYNSEKIITGLVARLGEELTKLGAVYELILVNDCSHDNSWEVIYQLDNMITTYHLLCNHTHLHKIKLLLYNNTPKMRTALADGCLVYHAITYSGVRGNYQ